MRRIDAFPGFVIKSATAQVFNPFQGETGRAAAPATATATATPAKREFLNVLDAPPSGSESAVPGPEPETIALFPRPRPQPTVPIPPTPVNMVPMVQPRGVDGQRRLYTHPNLPTVGPGQAYWLLVGSSDRSATASLLQFDGGANPNPGPASAGAVLWSPIGLDGSRRVLFESGRFLGRATNNIAEVHGLLLGLKIAATRGARELLIEGDSELIVFQQTGKYKVKDKNLKVWWSEIQAALMDETSFDWVAIRQVPRELNQRADSVTKEVLDRREGFSRG